MFATLRYDNPSNDALTIQHAADASLERSGPRNSACDRCRSRKVAHVPNAIMYIERSADCLLVQQRCSGQKSGCDRCKHASAVCAYPSVTTENEPNRRKRSSSTRQILAEALSNKASALQYETPRNEDAPTNKAQKLSKPDPPPSGQPVISGLENNGAVNTHDRSTPPVEDSQDYFALPSDFLQDVLPESELEDSGGLIADLNLDQYFVNEFLTHGFNPEGQDPSSYYWYPSFSYTSLIIL